MISIPDLPLDSLPVHLVGAVAVFLVGLVALKQVQKALERRLAKGMPKGMAQSMSRLANYVLVALLALLALDVAGFQIESLLVAGGIVGVAVGFASQTTVANLISGLFLYLDRPFDIGDSVEIGSTSGMVLDIAPLSTRIRTWDGPVVRLPNEKVFNSGITNYKKIAARRFQFDIGISYGSDVDKAIGVMEKVLGAEPYVLRSPGPSVYLSGLGDSAKVITVKAWAPLSQFYSVKHAVLKGIYDELTRAGIVLPNPQLDVHIKR
jgi:small-conductance mechanosensitive channel